MQKIIFLTILFITSFIQAQDNILNKFSSEENIKLPISDAPVTTKVNDKTRKQEKQESVKKQNSSKQKKTSEKTSTKQKILNEKSKEKKVTFIQEEFYEPKINEMSLEYTPNEIILDIKSKELRDFMEGGIYDTKLQIQTFALQDSYTQITNIEGKIYEYKYAQKSIDRYSAISSHQNYLLKKKSANKYQVMVKKIPPIFDITGCKIAIKKELNGTLNQAQEVIINLDTKRELRNNPHFEVFLECPK